MSLYFNTNSISPSKGGSGGGGGGSSSQIEATNYTGSAIISGDKVWINQENGENRLVDYYKNGLGFSNFDVYGQLEFSSKGETVKGFTTTKELQLSGLKSYSTGEINSMEMVFKIHTPTEGNWTSNGRIINSRKSPMWDDFSLDINQNRPCFCFINGDYSSNKTVQVAPVNMLSDTDYYIKVTFDGTNLYGYYSLDGENYTLQETKENSSSVLYLDSSYGYAIGNRHMNDNESNPVCVWNGSIDLSESYIKINDEIWWQSYEQGTQKQISRNILMYNASNSDYFIDNSGIYKSFILESSKSAHPYFNKVFNPGNSTWKLITKIKTPSSEETINKANSLFNSSNFFEAGIAIELNNGVFGWGVGAGSSDWSIGGGQGFTADTNTVYWLKLEFNGSKYSFSHSLDGIDYIEDGYINSTASIGNLNNSLINIGYHTSTRYWRGEIDLSETNIEVDGELWNDASETLTNITENTQTGIAAENIATGSTGLVNVGAIIEPTGSITITENGTHNVADYAEAVVNVPVPVVDKYKVGDRVNDDSDNPVGTVSGIKTDANGDRYAVCCLNGIYRGTGYYYSSNVTITNIPMYGEQTVWANKETATTNTDYILAMGETSSACNICRSASVTINGVTYSGQLPTIDELVDIFKNREIINSNDTSGVNPLPTATTTWSSTQYNNRGGWTINFDGTAISNTKQTSCFVTPVLEIPLED